MNIQCILTYFALFMSIFNNSTSDLVISAIRLVFCTVRATNEAFILSCNDLSYLLSIQFAVSRLFHLAIVLKFVFNQQFCFSCGNGCWWLLVRPGPCGRMFQDFFVIKLHHLNVFVNDRLVCVCVCVCVYQQQTCSVHQIGHQVSSQPVLNV
jgi:hypothetical protein